jgi:hypothetical protein
MTGCEPSLVLGELPLLAEGGAPGAGAGAGGVPSAAGAAGADDAAGAAGEGPSACTGQEAGAPSLNENGVYNEDPIPVPWSTSFEGGFCNYNDGAGFCYADGNSSFSVTTAPTRTGANAAAFEMRRNAADGSRQVRCVREGLLPEVAYYSAWYYLPADFGGARDWNLFHFRGGQVGGRMDGLWDVSISEDAEGNLRAYVHQLVSNDFYEQTDPVFIPRDTWFQLEFFLKRANDATGEIALYQDGKELVRGSGIITYDTPFGQWYVGNFAGTFSTISPTSTLYVDDVSIRLP